LFDTADAGFGISQILVKTHLLVTTVLPITIK
jgi:hypothetical protein